MTRNINQEFKIIEKLHEGEHWDVFLAEELSTQKKVILKLSSRYNFHEEAQNLQKLDHPHFIKLIDSGYDEINQQYYFIRDYHPGKTLDQNSPKSLDEILSLLASLSQTLFYLHQEGLVYLDLKPENIIWDQNKAILFDTSLIQPFDRSLESIPQGGSLAYMAPECLIGGHHLQQADFYSLGVILFELITGHLPFSGESTEELVMAHLFKEVSHPCLENEVYPRQLGDLTLRLLQKNPTQRIEDGNDLIRLINQIFDQDFSLEPVQKEFDEQEEKRIKDLDPKLFNETSISFLEKLPEKKRAHYHQLATLYFKSGKYEKLEKVLKELEPSEKTIFQAKVKVQTGDFKEAEKILSSLHQTLHLLSSQQKGDYHNIRGRVEYHLGNLNQSLNHFLLAWDAFNQDHDLEAKMNTDLNLGNAAVANQDWAKATQFYQRSLKEARELKNPILEGRAHTNLGYLAQSRLDYQTAYHDYKKAYEIFLVLGFYEEQIQSGINLGNLYLTFGSEIKAKEIIQEIGEVTKKINHHYYQSLYHLYEAEVYSLENNHEQAKKEIETGLILISKLGSPRDRFHFYLSLVENQINLHQTDQAKKYFDLSTEDLSNSHMESFQSRLEWWKIILDHPQKIPYAKLDQALENLEKAEDESYLIKCLLSIPSLYPDLDSLHYWNFMGKRILDSVSEKIPEEFRDSFTAKMENLKPKTEIISEPEINMNQNHHSSKNQNFMEKLLYLNAELTEELQPDQLLEKIMDVLIEITGFERGFILLSENQSLEQVFSKNYENDNTSIEEKQISTSLAQTVFNRNKSILTIDALNDERFSQTQSIHQLKLRSIACLPFSFKGQVLGVVYLDSRLKKSIFQKNELNLLEPFCHQIAIAISNARKFEKKNQEIEFLSQELKSSQKEISLKYSYDNIIGSDPSMIKMFKLLDKITDSHIPVIIGGESGSGKEMVAKVIHYHGKRKSSPFVSINCAAMPENLLEAELFGSVKGSFTGATQDKPGLFEIADGGSLFLDELGEMPLNMQAKLLRVLQEGEVRRIGGKQNIKVDVRIISATNKDLKDMISEKLFREDLYYRLVVASIKIPPLRERKNDIPLLTKYFLSQYAKKNDMPEKSISPSALKKLINYDWPGNVRELENFIYQLCVFSEEDMIEVNDLSIKEELNESIFKDFQDISTKVDEGLISLSEAKQEFEKREIKRILEKYEGHITKASEHLQVLRPQLSRLIKKYQLK